ncbi:pimeloyl-ACP methyl ester esterase BioH [Shewanella sedimentimangrovi]|uniref:Pimeloyl-[acyl-carrier protein] methyl ester esterase n=1 Tax=Shewanella sedimentimangrovi TaxID=2814293 RepID=A0ABX7R119_9GAMM|nr:pimeloyl-ACP methyl ester esterase BioH [Shewanella sedimentimangrovi]QSX37159.1 pimeloyl-ACP methyl ester esterase BioH [Shewanella sedimentimangrovi]
MQASLHSDIFGDGPPLVLLHGWGMNGKVFSPLQQALSKYKVHCVDLPGFGLSPAIKGDLDAWVDALMAMAPADAVWAGWSLGGLVATRAAQRHPQRLAGLITIASSPCFMAREQEAWPGIAPKVLAQFEAELQQDLPRTIERFLAIQAMGSDSAREDIKRIKELVLSRPLPQASALAQGLSMLEQVDLRPGLATMDLPWLRIWGRLDGLVPRRMMGQLPSNSITEDKILAKASHAPFISHGDEFVLCVTDWLDRLYSGKESG